MNNFEKQLIEILFRHSWFISEMDTVSDLGLPQWCIGAGVIRNIVFDYIEGVNDTPIRDVDVAYFDLSDLTEQTEKRYEGMLKQKIPHIPWEVKNQAAVHLWYHKKFGYKVPPVKGIVEAVSTWPETCTAVAVSKVKSEGYKVYAPYGLEDLFGMVVRRNRAMVDTRTYNDRISSKCYEQRWRSVKIIHEKS